MICGAASEWAPATGNVPLGSVLTHFIIYVNKIDIGFNNFLTVFAKDTKIGTLIPSRQTDTDSRGLYVWTWVTGGADRYHGATGTLNLQPTHLAGEG